MERDKITLIIGAGLGVLVVLAIVKAKGAVASIPQIVGDAISQAADWISPGGLVTTAPNAGRMADWINVRDTAPLTAYFRQVGNTFDARKSAEAKGWTLDEIGLAVASMTSDPLGMYIP